MHETTATAMPATAPPREVLLMHEADILVSIHVFEWTGLARNPLEARAEAEEWFLETYGFQPDRIVRVRPVDSNLCIHV